MCFVKLCSEALCPVCKQKEGEGRSLHIISLQSIEWTLESAAEALNL